MRISSKQSQNSLKKNQKTMMKSHRLLTIRVNKYLFQKLMLMMIITALPSLRATGSMTMYTKHQKNNLKPTINIKILCR